MQNKGQIIKNIAGIAVSAGIAVASQGSSGIILGVLNKVASGVTGGYLQNTDIGELKKFFKGEDPDHLNHNILEVIIEAIQWAAKNIEYKYNQQYNPSKAQKRELETFRKNFIAETKLLKDQLRHTDDSFHRIVDDNRSGEDILKDLKLESIDIPVIDDQVNFSTFFKDNFPSQFALCFGELLKSPRHRPALVAYQREVYSTIEDKLDLVLARLDEKEKPNDVKQLKEAKSRIASIDTNDLSQEFLSSFEDQLTSLHEKSDLIIDELGEIKGIAKGIQRDLNDNWLSKNKVWISGLIGALILIISALIYVNTTRSFISNVSVEVPTSIKINSEYPELSNNSRIRFYMPKETIDKELTFSNEILLSDINSNLKGKTIAVELIDKHWKTVSDSITLKQGKVQIPISPNESLAKIRGVVKSRSGQELIENVKVSCEGVDAMTDGRGQFELSLPIELRKLQYVVRVEKKNWQIKELEYIPGSSIEIRLHKEN